MLFRSWFDHHPVRRNPADPNRIWRSFRWGDTAEFFILDGRSERRPPSQYLSRAQMDWLKSSLAASTATFKFIVNSKPIVSEGSDSWRPYASRRELLDFILSPSRRVPGVVFLAGDVHYGAVAEVAVDSAGTPLHEIIMGPGANEPPGPVDNPVPNARRLVLTSARNSIRNFTVVRANPATREVSVSFIGATGAPIAGSAYTFRV